MDKQTGKLITVGYLSIQAIAKPICTENKRESEVQQIKARTIIMGHLHRLG